MLSVRLEGKVEAALAVMAKARGVTKSGLVREAVVRLVEDFEDSESAMCILAKTKSGKPLRQLRKEVGMDG
jgi:predicted DNA-binding protein